MGLEDVGRLVPGARADLAGFSVSGSPADPFAALVESGRCVLTVVAGVPVAGVSSGAAGAQRVDLVSRARAGDRGGDRRARTRADGTGQVWTGPSLDRAGLDKAPGDVARMFDHVAPRYDVTNTVLSLGQDRRWRAAVRDALDLRPGLRVLDLAGGTGTSALAFARSGAVVVACDFSLGMLAAGRPRVAAAALPTLTPGASGRRRRPAAALRRPLVRPGDDLVRAAQRRRRAGCLRELRRVTRPGGRLVICEFSRPTWAPFRAVYLNYLMRALPPLARAVSSAPDAYVYLAESIRVWPSQAELAAQVAAAGWSEVGWRNLSGGIVALHRATAPGPEPAAAAAPAEPARVNTASAGKADESAKSLTRFRAQPAG